MTAARISLVLGTLSFLLIAGALAFQYLGGLAPCEMCEWQRWPHIAGALVGIMGGAAIIGGTLDAKYAPLVAGLTIALVAASGAIAVYHVGIEWKWWAGPSACTGARVEFTGLEGINDKGMVRCDLPQWQLFGVTLAGYNALLSLGAALAAAYYIAMHKAR